MTDPIVELAGMLDSGTTSGEVMGTAAAASSGGQVQVMVGPNAIACTDLPSKPAAAGDTLVIRSGNAPVVVRNLTREKNPPVAPPDTSVNQALSTVDQRTTSIPQYASSGVYDYSIGTVSVSLTGDAQTIQIPNVTEIRNYLRDLATGSRAQAGDQNTDRAALTQAATDLNVLRSDVTGVATNTNLDRTNLMQIGNTLNNLIAQLKAGGYIS